MTSKILVPYDFSPAADAALAWAASLAATLDAGVLLMHVVAPAPVDVTPEASISRDASTDEVARARSMLESAAAKLGLRDAEVLVVVAPKVADMVIATAAERRATLIAMGTHGRGGLRRAVLGSVADRVVRHASQPVMVVRAEGMQWLADAAKRQRESGVPGGGKGRSDATSPHGVFPYSVQPHPPSAEPELRTPASLTPNAPYEESGRSELSSYHGVVVGTDPGTEPPRRPPGR